MISKKIYSFGVLAVVVVFTFIFSTSTQKETYFSETVKIALRDVGNQLLLANSDSTSLILPVIELEESKYQLSFAKEFSLKPDDLVSIVETSFRNSALPNSYLVELIQQTDGEVAYSYEMKGGRPGKSIIPCFGRALPEKNYALEVRFTEIKSAEVNSQAMWYAPAFIVLFLLVLPLYKNKQEVKSEVTNEKPTALGQFLFYQSQHKLVKGERVIKLSKKECELLALLSENPNQIIKREVLTKRIWEDNGVFVGRSLDTYVSKLRKLLKEDESIQITNVHGIGYKLEVIS